MDKYLLTMDEFKYTSQVKVIWDLMFLEIDEEY